MNKNNKGSSFLSIFYRPSIPGVVSTVDAVPLTGLQKKAPKTTSSTDTDTAKEQKRVSRFLLCSVADTASQIKLCLFKWQCGLDCVRKLMHCNQVIKSV